MDSSQEPEMSGFSFRITKGLDQLCKRNGRQTGKLQNYLSKQIWSPSDRQAILTLLSELFLEFSCTEDVCWSFRFLILEIIYRAEDYLLGQSTKPIQYLCIALSKAITICPNLKGIAEEFLRKYGLFPANHKPGEPAAKKRKKESHTEKLLDLQLCQAAWRFSKYISKFSSSFSELDELMKYLDHTNKDIRWFAFLAIAEITGMSAGQKEQLKGKLFCVEETKNLLVLHNEIEGRGKHVAMVMDTMYERQSCNKQEKYTKHCLLAHDLGEKVTSVEGILLSKLSPIEDAKQNSSGLVMVPSTRTNLRNLAMAVSSGQPVLLQGPVGSGKTSLVEELARITGRDRPPGFIKLQLGDQTDSKALLGTYRCTDVPGEFVWQPGVLTQAVKGGHWLLLEDVDYAPMDVLSVLLPLLENQTLCLPGHGDSLHAKPGFHIFFTQRLFQGATGWHNQSTSNSAVLSKLWRQINIESLSREELCQVITQKYPALSTVVDRLLDIYIMLSSGKHEISWDSPDTSGSSIGKFLTNEGRLISTRDLMTWCRRIAVGFDVSSPESAIMVFQNALDCFCACVCHPDKRTAIAEAIAAKLNINKVKAEFYCSKYKPTVEISPSSFSVGRVCLQKEIQPQTTKRRSVSGSFAFTRQSAVLLERVAVCVTDNEPVLLVGETGTGKTSTVQYLAQQLGHDLKVINMNQQSDSSDLLGGFKPVDVSHVVRPFKEDFELLFCQTFSRNQNIKFLQHVQECFVKRRWSDLFSLIEHTQKTAIKKSLSDPDSHKQWTDNLERLHHLKLQVLQTERALAFTFIEGTLVKALRSGDWVLLDEINLATAETLECLSGLLESTSGSVLLSERGDTEPILRHENFRLFACMNPATDVGKKDLPLGIRNRFTELYVDEVLSVSDLTILTAEYLRGLSLSSTQIDGIVKFYLVIKKEADRKLTDGTGHKPHFSLRTLCRALRYASRNPCVHVSRSLYEGFCLSFLTQLDRSSHPIVQQLICQHILAKTNVKSVLKRDLPEPPNGQHINMEGYWIRVGQVAPSTPDNYILTPSVRSNLKDLARIVSAGHHPVLLQGETSVGKTSLVMWLAKTTGHYCVRVNNHEHTDLQEYIGTYTADHNGKLTFKEGVLVEAMRKGHWIILDELNLAPSDVLEALNRLLDDNRELFIPETQETVKAHPRFMLFSTQNPPGQYGGRKVLSRAFRNRFIELHFDEIPSKELETILHKRCDLPLSYGRKLVAVMLELQIRRRGSSVFAGKQGYMTLRDLFRWANRYHSNDNVTKAKFYDWDQHMADHGYMVLAGRVRKPEECSLVREVIQKHLKRTCYPERLYTLSDKTSTTTSAMLESLVNRSAKGFEHIVWTYSMRRLAILVGQAIKFKEPILLVGDTGCGKTTVCQFLSALQSQDLHSINCHMHSESADFLGGLRPVRCRSELPDGDQRLFEWVDGPLVLAMRQGHMFLIDEISLADDSVLERLNSVLEPERCLLLAEKGGSEGVGKDVEEIVASDEFQVFATMNPGGDYGKKELSPALRNRFTEVWCPQVTERDDLVSIIEHNLNEGFQISNQEDCTTGIGRSMVEFVTWFTNNDFGTRVTVSIRDYLSWVSFMNVCGRPEESMVPNSQNPCLDPALAYIHGACLVFLDALGSGGTTRSTSPRNTVSRELCLSFLTQQVNKLTGLDYTSTSLGLLDKSSLPDKNAVCSDENLFSIPPFSITKGEVPVLSEIHYSLLAPTPCVNGQRILRALQLSRPLLLEGSPGVGKTSLVTALAKASGRELVRINLSEQTDVSDLFGADLPVEGAKGGVFAWRDGPLLQALKRGHWIVLDELNLASQSVLEGLNACLDHRAEVYVPELGRTFQIQHEKTRIFACQNPLNQGGGRKGLPRSFLNRFTQVYIEPLSEADLLFISSTMYPMIPQHILSNMVRFNSKLHQAVMVEGRWGQRGAPWEFNLRDIFRWCELMVQDQSNDAVNPGQYIHLLYGDRMRSESDKTQIIELFKDACPDLPPPYTPGGAVKITSDHIQVHQSFLPRKFHQQQVANQKESCLYLLHHSLSPLESLMKCVEMKWMAILVGPQSSGKTSLVRLLSKLTGATLHVLAMNSAMDTTELLGGFEQANISRHIEEVAGILEEKVCQYCIKALLNSQTKAGVKTVRKTWQLWNQYISTATKGKQSSNVAELISMKAQVKCLTGVVETLESHCGNNDEDKAVLQKCKVELSRVSNSLEQTSSRQSGTFEWIDSILVRALQTGDWLLIDNVNFCSASVLDRLNALLEPNGVLSINERGVIDGQVPVIRPHPNFRLFLSMDPKFGEISRAMRNRGVEIYLLGEDEGGCFDNIDIKTVLHGLGLCGQTITDWLISVHQDVREMLIGGQKPIIQDLFNVAILTRQEVERGVPITEALKFSCQDIYVKNLKVTAAKKKTEELLNEKFKQIEDEVVVTACDIPELGLVPIPPISIDDYSQDPALANTIKISSLICYAWKQLTNLILKRNEIADSEELSNDVQEKFNMLKYAAKIFLEQLSFKDWQLSATWLEKFENKELCNAGELIKFLLSHGISESQVSIFRDGFFKAYINKVKAMLTSSVAKEYEDFLASLQPDLHCLLLSESYDPRWGQQCLALVLRQISLSQDGESAKEKKSLIEHYSNRLYILSYLMERQLIEEAWVRQVKPRDKSPLALSYTFHQGTQGWTSLDHPALHHLYPFYSMVYSYLMSTVPSLPDFTDDKLHQVLRACQWIFRLFELCKNRPQSGFRSLQALLHLHWNWFFSKTLPVLSALSPDRLPDDLQSAITTLNSFLGQDNSRSKLYLKILRHYGHTQRYQNEREADVQLSLRKFCHKLENDSCLEQEVCNQESIDKAVRMAMAVCDELLKDGCDFDIMEQDVEKIKTLLSTQNLSSDEPMETDYSNVPAAGLKASTNQMKRKIEPLFEFVGLLSELFLIGQICDGGICIEGVKEFTDYCLEHCNSNPMSLSLIRTIQNTENDEERWRLTISSLLMTWQKLWNGILGTDPCKSFQISCDKTETHELANSTKTLLNKGPGVLQLSPLMFIVHHMLGYNMELTKNTVSLRQLSLSPVNIPLGEFNEMTAMFTNTQQLIWLHSSAFASPKFDLRSTESTRALLLLCKLLQSMVVVFISKEDSNHWLSLIEDIKIHKYNLSPSIQKSFNEFVTKTVRPTLGVDTTNILLTCVENACKLFSSSDNPPLVAMGTLWVYVGLLQSLLLAPVGPVDPIVKQKIKLQYIDQELMEIEEELKVRDLNQRLLSGTSLDETRTDILHPRVIMLFTRRKQLDSIRIGLESQHTFRPEPPKFEALIQDATNYQQTSGDPAGIVNLLEKLTSLNDQISFKNSTDCDTRCLKEEAVFQSSQSKFLTSLTDRYPGYQDLVEPFVLGIEQMRYGMRIVCQFVSIQHQRSLWERHLPSSIHVSNKTWLEDVILALGKFPSINKEIPNLVELANRLTSAPFLQVVKSISDSSDSSTEGHLKSSHTLISRILLNALQFLHKGAESCGTLSSDVLSCLYYLLEVFVTMWGERETKKRLKDEEEASLYHFKSTTFGDDLTEDERDEKEFKRSFPRYEEDFSDVIEKTELGDGQKDIDEQNLEEDILLNEISDQEMTEVWKTHQHLFSCLTESDWLNKSPMPESVTTLHPMLSCYQIGAQLGKLAVDKMNYNVDKELVGGHMAMISAVQQTATLTNITQKAGDGDVTYDIYHDSNVSEAIKCRPVLERFRTRVRELQCEWPDHPTLKQLILITERLLTFAVTCPLMKFLSGLEFLLQKSQDWESNAAKFVSLTSQLHEVTEMIVEWRKLELSCWNKSMETVLVKCRLKASKWWFHIYQLLQSVLNEENQTHSQELPVDSMAGYLRELLQWDSPVAKKGDKPLTYITQIHLSHVFVIAFKSEPTSDAKTDKDVVSTLTQFLESSPLGEFATRLEMMYGFHCQLVHEKSSPKQEWLLCLLWNLYQFYRQFLPPVTEELTRLRSPIEKELKGFVKIARWNDINYWALKQTTQKTHRTVFKHMKAFQSVLGQPIKALLVETKSETILMPLKESWPDIMNSRRMEIAREWTKHKETSTVAPPSCNEFESSLLERLPTLCHRMTKHCSSLTKTDHYSQDVLTLDEFTVEIIEAIEELQSLEVNKDAEKEKQKSEAKNINLRKRKALSDLFKSLSDLGLSYRRGLVLNQTDIQRECLEVPPVDVSKLMTRINRESSSLSRLWEGCSHYFYRCMSRRAQYKVALETPSQELGVANIDRCRGFSEQMISLLIGKHTEASQLASCYGRLAESTSVLSDLNKQISEQDNLPPQKECLSWLSRIRNLFISVKEGLKQFHSVLQCCPEITSATGVCMSPLQQRLLSQAARMRQGDEQWMEIVQCIEDVLSGVQKSCSSLNTIDHKKLIFRCDIQSLHTELSTLTDYVPRLEQIATQFDDPVTKTPNCLNEVLYFLIGEIKDFTETFRCWQEKISLINHKDGSDMLEGKMFSDLVEKLVMDILLAVQNITKIKQQRQEKSSSKSKADEEEPCALKDKHLTNEVIGNLKEDLNLLNCSKITKQITLLLDSLRGEATEISISGETLPQSYLCLIAPILPVLRQYTTLVEYYLSQVIATHRVTGKLLSVLLKVFTDLAIKGFCLPAEFAGDMDGEGSTQFEDIEGGGLGEGEGAKDVSDQIETEDQLHDTQKAGEEKTEEASDQPDVQSEDNAIEMSDDFEGKMHDLEQGEGEDDDSDKGDNEDDKLDKQMGDVDSTDADKLDEQMWGSDDEQENQEEEKETNEESGPGAGKQSESELVAKDDNQDKTEREGEKETEAEGEDKEENKQQQHDLEQLDDTEYDDNRVDPHSNQPPEEPPDGLDLPDDLQLDEEETGEGDKDDQAMEHDNVDEPTEDDQQEAGEDNSVETDENKGDNPDNEQKKEDESEPMDTSGTEEANEETVQQTPEEDDHSEDKGDKDKQKEGVSPDDDSEKDTPHEDTLQSEEAEKAPEQGETSHDVDNTEQSETAKDKAGTSENNQDESDGIGQSTSQLSEGHEGQSLQRLKRGGSSQEKQQKQKNKPGVSDSERTLGNTDSKYKRLMTQQNSAIPEDDTEEKGDQSDLYEHIKDAKSHSDAQTLDVATSEQQEEQPVPNMDIGEETEPMEDEEAESMKPIDNIENMDEENVKDLKSAKLKGKKTEEVGDKGDNHDAQTSEESLQYQIEGDNVLTMRVGRGPESTIHTVLEHLNIQDGSLDVEKLRAELEDRLAEWHQPQHLLTADEAMEAWYRYEAITSSLSQDLCEQLRLVLEPTQATKLKGDYRTGKRLNMRKVIPYIASEFRKDAIWLRRTKPSKREYQILIAMDDSASMTDNHSKQLAFESLAVISNALTLLEAGQLGICSFGESVKVLHPFTEQFTSQSGARILHQFTFEQKKTKIAQLLKEVTGVLLEARSKVPGAVNHSETAQLLLVVSDGRGLFLEGMDVVKSAVRQARAANIFVVFVVIDNPECKDSILDIKVPCFKGPGQLPEIQSYMDHFPFPFYLILRDINSLPSTLSDALRQWFELVTASDR